MSLSFRKVWYAVILWIIAFLASGLVISPWFYIVMPLLVLLVTVYYFDWRGLRLNNKRDRDEIVRYGFAGAIFWFVTICILSLLELAGFYYFDFEFYFSDFKNVFLFPVVLLVPAVYGIVLSNKELKRYKKGRRVTRAVSRILHF